MTRPTYQGLLLSSSKLHDIITLCHDNNIPVIIDEAHGSHLRFLKLDQFQGILAFISILHTLIHVLLASCSLKDGLSCGADIVIQSSHKTLGALSQCAMMHLNKSM